MIEYYYKFYVVHDKTTKPAAGSTPQNPKYTVNGNIGHFYTILETNDPAFKEREVFSYGPTRSGAPIGPGHIDKRDEDRIDRFLNNKDLTEDASHIFKTVPLAKEQYQGALAEGQYIRDHPGLYVGGAHDCMVTVQAIWRAAGLKGDFADLFTRDELFGLQSLAGKAAHAIYGSGDKPTLFLSVYDRETVAKLHGVPVEDVEFAGTVYDVFQYYIKTPMKWPNTDSKESAHAAQTFHEEFNHWRDSFHALGGGPLSTLFKLTELPLENPILAMLAWRDPTRMLSEVGRLRLASDGLGYVPFVGHSGSALGNGGLGPGSPSGPGGGGSNKGGSSGTSGTSESSSSFKGGSSGTSGSSGSGSGFGGGGFRTSWTGPDSFSGPSGSGSGFGGGGFRTSWTDPNFSSGSSNSGFRPGGFGSGFNPTDSFFPIPYNSFIRNTVNYTPYTHQSRNDAYNGYGLGYQNP